MKGKTKKLLSLVLSAAMLITSIPAVPAKAAEAPALKPLKLQYKTPANKGSSERNNWERWALPLGNGHMGAMVFGRTDTERIQMNEKTLWTGGTGGSDNEPGGEYEKRDSQSDAYGNVDAYGSGAMERYIDYLFDLYYDNGKVGADPAQSGSMKILPNNRSALGDYQNFAEMYLDFDHPTAQTSNYRRELDLRTALSTVTYTYNGVTYTREMFADHPDNVMVYRITADEPGSIDMVMHPEIPDLGTSSGGHSKKVTKEGTVVADEAAKTVTMQGRLVNNNMKFAGLFHVENEGGTVTALNPSDTKGQLKIEDADSVTIYITLATNYKNVFPDYRQEDADYAINDVTSRMEAAEEKGYDALLENHLEDYQGLFSRNELDLGGKYDAELETDQLLSQWISASGSGTQNHYLEELYYQYGRYMMIASTREDTLPNNLQGIWNDRAFADWQADYHTNINLQMNYWPAFNTDLAECGMALVDYVDSLQEPGALTAKKLYGVDDAWMVNCSANALGFTGNINSAASLASTANAFLLQNVYDCYRFTQDKEMLKTKIYPMMTGACNFFLQVLRPGRSEADKDKLFMTPSYSSEQTGTWTIGAYFDQQLIYLLFKDTLEAAAELGIDNEFTKQVAGAMERLYPAAVGDSGQIKEWQQEGTYNTNKYTNSKIGDAAHRHNSQLMVLHPGNIVTTETKELMSAAARTLNLRGDGATGWSMGQKFNMWARLQDGNHAYDKLFVNLMKNGTATNLFDLHPPFQIDGNFGGTAGIVELLMQSHAGYVSILPALPDKLANGSVKGLVAEGNFGVDITWAKKAITDLQLTSRSGNRLALKAGVVEQIIDVTAGKKVTDITQDANGAVSFDTVKGHVYKVVPGTAVSSNAVKKLVDEVEAAGIVPYANTTETGSEFEEAFMACKLMAEQGNYVASDVEKTTARLTAAIEGLEERKAEEYGAVLALSFLENAAAVNYEGTATEDLWRQEIEYDRADLKEALLAEKEDGAAITAAADTLVAKANKLAGYAEERLQLYDLLKKAKGLDQASRTEEEWAVYNGKIADITKVFADAASTAERLQSAYDSLTALIATMETVFNIETVVEGNGTVSPCGNIAVLGGAGQKFTMTPEEESIVLDVLLDGKSVGAVTEYTVKNVTKDMELKVIFQKVEAAKKSETEILLDYAIAKAKSLEGSDYMSSAWNAVTAALETAESTDRTDDAAMKANADALLTAIDKLAGWGEAVRTEAEASKLWPVENANPDDSANWGDKEIPEGAKIIGGYPDSGRTAGQNWAEQTVSGVSNGKQMFIRQTPGAWVKFRFEGSRVRYLAEKALEGTVLGIYIDGELIDSIDYVTGSSSINPRLNVAFDSADYDLDLSDGTHELKVAATKIGSSGSRLLFRVDAFDEYPNMSKIVQTKALAEVIAKASALSDASYTAGSWKEMKASLDAAVAVFNHKEADQAAVDAAVKDLAAKIAALESAKGVITSVTELMPVQVAFGAAAKTVKELLPESVVVSADSGVMRRVEVVWDLVKFDGQKGGAVTLDGELIIPEGLGIINENHLKAKIDVIVGAGQTKFVQAERWTSASETAKENNYGPDGTAAGGSFKAGDFLGYAGVDFENGKFNICLLEISALETENGKKAELRLDAPDGELIGSVTISATNDNTVFADHYAEVKSVSGMHTLYIVFPEDTAVNIDFFTLSSYNGAETEAAKEERLQWFRDAKFGQFIHFGAYSYAEGEYEGRRPNGGAEWIMKLLNISKEDYAAKVAKKFNPQEFDAKAYVDLAKAAGQKYLVFTTRHHEGFSMFETDINEFKDYQLSSYGDYQGEDPVKVLAEECKAQGIAFGAYYSIPDWHDKAQSDYDTNIDPALKADYIQRMKGQLRELIEKYDPEILWFDGNWMSWWTHEDALGMYRYVRTLKPEIIINNRVGTKQIMVGDYGTPEQTIPATGFDYAWESCMTLNGTWGYKYYDNNWKDADTVVDKLVDIASKGGNYLLNIGPDSQGRIPEKTTEIFTQVGEWMSVYGDSIYDCGNTCFESLPGGVKATTKDGKVYLHVDKWNSGSVLNITKLKNEINGIKVMGTDTEVPYTIMKDKMVLTLPEIEANAYDTVIEIDVNGVPETAPAVYENIARNAVKAEASNVYKNNANYNADKAKDGNTGSRWATDDGTKEATLTLTFEKPVTVSETVLDVYGSGKNSVTKYQIEYLKDGEWKAAYTGTGTAEAVSHVKMGGSFAPVTSDQIRLHILEAQNPTIWEFELYYKESCEVKVTAPSENQVLYGFPFTMAGTAQGGASVEIEIVGDDFGPDLFTADVKEDGTWSCDVKSGSERIKTITVRLKDEDGNTVAVTEAKVNVRDKGENLALNAKYSASTSYREPDYGPGAAADSDLSTRWAPKDVTDPQWMVVDFGEMKAFDTVLISEFFDTYNTPNDYRCTKFNVEYFDGTEWKMFHEGTAIGEKSVIAKDPVIGSKVRLNLLGTKANGGKSPANILEFEIYSTKEAPEKTEFDVRVNGKVVQTGAYNTKVTITAPEAPEGKEFTGWKLNGILISGETSYTFYIAGDMDFEACYDAVEEVPAAMLAGTQVTKQADGKSDLKFVAQLAVPEGYTVLDAGLLWLTNDNETAWGTAEGIADGVKVTHITKMNTNGQFSVTIKGVPAGRFVRGVIYAKVTNGTETFVYSQERKVMEK